MYSSWFLDAVRSNASIHRTLNNPWNCFQPLHPENSTHLLLCERGFLWKYHGEGRSRRKSNLCKRSNTVNVLWPFQSPQSRVRNFVPTLHCCR